MTKAMTVKSTELVKATGSRGLRHVVSTITGDGGDGDVQGTASHHRGCTAACPKGEGRACSGCHMGFGNITPDTWKALCAEYEEFDKFEAEYKSTPLKPKTRVKYKGRWYRVRKRHRTTIATGSLYQMQPVGGGKKLVNKCAEKDLTPRTRHIAPADLFLSTRAAPCTCCTTAISSAVSIHPLLRLRTIIRVIIKSRIFFIRFYIREPPASQVLSAHISCDSTPQHVHHPQHPCECDSCLPSLFAVCHNDALHHLRVGADGGNCGDKLEARVETISGDRLSLSLCCCLPWAGMRF